MEFDNILPIYYNSPGFVIDITVRHGGAGGWSSVVGSQNTHLGADVGTQPENGSIPVPVLSQA
ncbi:MAG: hypothetical protein RL681_805 [Candidatus Parcubacteria bacterium]|jgi:hypothetical protein